MVATWNVNRYISHAAITISVFNIFKLQLKNIYSLHYCYYFGAAQSTNVSLSTVSTDFFVLLLIPQFLYLHSSFLIFSHTGTSLYPFTSITVPVVWFHFSNSIFNSNPGYLQSYSLCVTKVPPPSFCKIFYYSCFLVSFSTYLLLSFNYSLLFLLLDLFLLESFSLSIHYPYYHLSLSRFESAMKDKLQ